MALPMSAKANVCKKFRDRARDIKRASGREKTISLNQIFLEKGMSL
jgi:hypothetical protein